MPKRADLYIMRHGPTDWSAEKRLQGRADRPLTETGRAEVRSWANRAPQGAQILTSPLQRALETATILYPTKRINQDIRLIEMDFGAWEGHRLKDLRTRFGEAFQTEEARGLDMHPPAGESPRQVQARLRPLIAEIALRGDATALIAHKGVIRALYALATGWRMTSDPPDKLRDGCYHHLSATPKGDVSVIALNQALGPKGSA